MNKANMEAYIYALENVDLEALEVVAQRLCNTLNNKGRILVAGNGGSHAISQHFACDIMKAVGHDNLCCQVQCLGDNVAMLTAIANDIGCTDIFAKQAALVGIHDTVIAFSVSGTSPNIRNLLCMANENGASVYLIRGCGVNQKVSGRIISVTTGYESNHPLHYYACETGFSAIAHEIARLFHIKRGNYA